MNLQNFLILEDKLKSDWVNVSFIKKDGSLREMKCTTNLELIPVDSHPKQKEIEQTESNDSTFDVNIPIELDKIYKVFEENKGWRSFRRSQIIQVDTLVFEKWTYE